MRHFFPKNTVEAIVWCVKCHKETVHQVHGGRPHACSECMKTPAVEEKKKPEPPKQAGLFE
jgi:hypothetical protein